MDTNINQDSDETQTHQTGEADIVSEPKDSLVTQVEALPGGDLSPKRRSRSRGRTRRFWTLFSIFTYIVGLGSGYILWGRQAQASASNSSQASRSEMEAMAAQINPKEGYKIPATFGDIGPKLLAAGAIDLDQFEKVYQEMGKPLSKEEMAILSVGSSAPVVINQNNQQFLLNLFWAFGLANQNRVLTEGPMMTNGKDKVVSFASTGGWTIAAKPIKDLYASSSIISLTEEQQKRLEEVAQAVYRPCCDNPTHFPDCNHGMAMLGLLELMASQNASTDQMFKAAKYVNAYWFPQQTLEIAVAFKAAENVSFDKIDPQKIVSQGVMSGSGFQGIHQWLAQNGKLEQAPQGGGSCAVK